MQVLIIGGEGQLGSSIERNIPKANFKKVVVTRMDQLDISTEDNIKAFFASQSFDYVVNCTAYTAVDKAETDVGTARVINALAPKWIAKYAARQDAGVIHVSTDYVFDGTSNLPLTPEMSANPVSSYGKTKLEGEELVIAENPRSIIIRTSWLYSEYGQNFVKTMLRLAQERDVLKVVYDQIGTPTYAGDLADVIIKILLKAEEDKNNFNPGIYHYSNEGVCSWYDFAIAIFSISGIDCKVLPVRTEEFPTPAKRPSYSVMDKSKICNQFEIDIPYWMDSLKICIHNLSQSGINA